jgi:hypothetical protein
VVSSLLDNLVSWGFLDFHRAAGLLLALYGFGRKLVLTSGLIVLALVLATTLSLHVYIRRNGIPLTWQVPHDRCGRWERCLACAVMT